MSATKGRKPDLAPRASLAPRPSRRTLLVVLLLGLLITAGTCVIAATLDAHSEARLLKVQTNQAAEVLAAAISNTATPLATAINLAAATNGDATQFRNYLATYVGSDQEFAFASLWHRSRGRLQLITTIGSPPDQAVSSIAVRSMIERSFESKTFVVDGIARGSLTRLGYAYAGGSTSDFSVYVEHEVPKDKKAAVASNSAFADLFYAIYLGASPRQQDLLATSFTHLPVSGASATVRVPFGTSTLTLVATPADELAGWLSNWLALIAAIFGVILSIIAAWTADRLERRRRSAELDAVEIGRLYGELSEHYKQQRSIAETLQHALLPAQLPNIPGMEIAARYVPGAQGVDIGGDWYSVVAITADRFAFVVGDVSGRGVSAASVMASLRFTIRAYAFEDYAPELILERCSRQLDIVADGHFATVLVGTVDTSRRELTLANAGHLNPVLIDRAGARVIPTRVGPPIGVAPTSYEAVTVALPPGATLLAFTDGLVERRDESLDIGFQRLLHAATKSSVNLDDLVRQVITELTDDNSEDDVAILGVRWIG